MGTDEPVNILLVDDQPGKLLSYEAVLAELGENLIRATSAQEALQQLLRTEFAVILTDVCMPQLDGFQLAEMIRDHPRFDRTAILFISAVQLSDADRVRGYQLGAVDYVPVPILPELLRAKVKVFAELYRKTRQLESLNRLLERRVEERTAELEVSNARLRLAIDVARLGTWDWDLDTGVTTWSHRCFDLFGYAPDEVTPTVETWRARVHPEDASATEREVRAAIETRAPFRQIYRVLKGDDDYTWCDVRGQLECDESGKPRRMLGVAMDISEFKASEERQTLMMRELHHRVKNTLATVQAIANLTARSTMDIADFRNSFAARIQSLGRTHTMLIAENWRSIDIRTLLDSELGSFADHADGRIRLSGPSIDLPSETALSLGLALHELTTNAVKHGALSNPSGRVAVTWMIDTGTAGEPLFSLSWLEEGGPPVAAPRAEGFGSLLLKRLFGAQKGGSSEIVFAEPGLRFRAQVPLAVAAGRPLGGTV